MLALSTSALTPALMPAAAAASTPPLVPLASLSHWLRLLWAQAPALHLGSEQPFISAGAIHLPAQPCWQAHRAAAAHAAAHLVYSPARFDATGLVPIARALLALLEDARVEALASRELPGLMRLWQPLHCATPAAGTGFEALMLRLARALADPAYADPHPWVGKGRRLFYLDADLQLLALRTPAELRQAASVLGHDIGQMRLPFNAKGFRPGPNYRDDHRWMWDADALAAMPPPSASPASPASAADDAPRAQAFETRTRHPEWDHRIARLRPDWCTVVERAESAPQPSWPALDADGSGSGNDRIDDGIDGNADSNADTLQLGRRLRPSLRTLVRPLAERRRARQGEVFDIDALVDWRVARRLHVPCEARLYRARSRHPAQAAVWLLIDQSASSADRHGSGPSTVLRAATQAAAATAWALQTLGVACAVSGFSSNGRHGVRLHTVKGFDACADHTLRAGLQALHSGGSTRLGAALRHTCARLASGRPGARWVLLLSDGEPHDVDVHDPRYLIEDARHAVLSAARHAVRMACITLVADTRRTQDTLGATGVTRRIFGRHGTRIVAQLDALPRAVQGLMA